MNKIIGMIVVLASITAFAATYTYTTRIDDTSESGVTYIGKAASDHSATSTNTTTSLESKSVWMIVKVTETNVLHSGGSAFLYNEAWTNRLNATYK